MREIKIVNLTDQTIRVYPDEYSDVEFPVKDSEIQKVIGRCIELPSSGRAHSQITRDVEGALAAVKNSKKKITLSYSHIGVVSGLPPESEGTIYIVSQMTYNSIHHSRKDVYMIDKPVRAANGGVIACRGFSRCVYDKDMSVLDTIDSYLKKKFAELPNGDEANRVSNCIITLNKYRAK